LPREPGVLGDACGQMVVTAVQQLTCERQPNRRPWTQACCVTRRLHTACSSDGSSMFLCAGCACAVLLTLNASMLRRLMPYSQEARPDTILVVPHLKSRGSACQPYLYWPATRTTAHAVRDTACQHVSSPDGQPPSQYTCDCNVEDRSLACYCCSQPQPTWLNVHHLVHPLRQEGAACNDQAASCCAALKQGHSTRVVPSSKHTRLWGSSSSSRKSEKWVRRHSGTER
jgi:hypothetical protein